MRNRRLYKIEGLHTLGTPESKRVKVTALPSPKRLAFAAALARRGYAQAGLNLFHPTASPPFPKNRFFILRRSLSRGEGICLKGVNCDGKMVESCFDIELYLFFPSRVCRNVEGYWNSMSEMWLFLSFKSGRRDLGVDARPRSIERRDTGRNPD